MPQPPQKTMTKSRTQTKTRNRAIKAKETKTTRRPRTFTGCGTCRSRHLKCDEAKPICSSCRRLNLECQGYTPRLLWLPASQTADNMHESNEDTQSNSFRFPLFSDTDRTSMSADMIGSLDGRSADNALQSLDTASSTSILPRTIGPFGLFSINDELSIVSDETNIQKNEDICPLPVQDGELPSLSSISISDSLWDSFSTDSTSTVIPFSTELLATDSTVLNDSFLFDSLGLHDAASPIRSPRINSPVPKTPCNASDEPDSRGSNHMQEIANDTETASPFAQSLLANEVSANGDNLPWLPSRLETPTLPPHTATLLQYLQSDVLDTKTSSSPQGMSPWRHLFLPCALETVAETTLWNSASTVRRSILSSLLAKSAFHLCRNLPRNSSSAKFWHKIGKGHYIDSRRHLAAALKAGDQNVKYTEMLMAILGAGVVSTHYNGASIMNLLLEAERWIRRRGLPSTKSLQHRILHHMYTHLRLIVESTTIMNTPTDHELDQDPRHSFEMITSRSPRSFTVSKQCLGDLDAGRDKSEDIGYNDIHLDVSGKFQMTLFPQIYGIPESLMTLLSQTISLANEKPRLEALAAKDHNMFGALSRHLNTLEQQIWSWNGPSDASKHTVSFVSECEPTDPRTLAMQQALIIFFYRRIYNMNAMVVQEQVRKCLESIVPCLETAQRDSDLAVSIGWTIFIAACEAVSKELQDLSMQHFDTIDDCGMYFRQGKPSHVAKMVWEHRASSNNFTFSWPDLMTQPIPIA